MRSKLIRATLLATAAVACAATPAAAISQSGMAVQADGTAHFSWIKRDGTWPLVQARSWPAADAFGPPEWISTAQSPVDTNAIAVDGSGVQTIVYRQVRGDSREIFARRRFSDGGLSPVLRLSERAASAPDVAVGADGTAVVVFLTASGNGERNKVVARRITSAGTVLPIVTVSSTTYDADQPQVAVAPDGTAVIAWRRTNPGPGTVATRALSAGGVLSPIQLASYGGAVSHEPQVGVDGAGNAILAWRREFDGGERVQLRRRDAAGALSATQTVSAPGFPDVSGVRLAADPAGRSIVTWAVRDAGNVARVRMRARAADGTLSLDRLLSGPEEFAHEPAVAMEPDGDALFAWRGNDSGAAEMIVRARRRQANGTLGATQELSAEAEVSLHPKVGVASTGAGVVSWENVPLGGEDDDGVLEARRRSPTGVLGEILGVAR